jgi:hypothetical protein
MHFSWLGIVNEPNDTKEGILDTVKAADGSDSIFVQRRVPVPMYPELVKIMRRSLDAYGLDSMKIMGPEVSSVDDVCYQYLNAVQADSAAMEAFEVLFSKAYNMCASKDMKKFALDNNLPYLAAAGANTIEGKASWMRQFPYENTTDNTHYAADAAARILNDLNHGVTHWATYFNVQEFYHVEPSHRLIWRFDNMLAAMGSISDAENGFELGPDLYLVISLKYYYMKHLAQTMDAGGIFRNTRISTNLPTGTSEDMVYTYGRKPDIESATLYNPDSTMTAAIVNLTGAISDTAETPKFTYGDSVAYTVNITVEEMADIPKVKFGVIRSNQTLRLAAQDSVTMTNGTMSITVAPLELVTLRSDKVAVQAGIADRHANSYAGSLLRCRLAGQHLIVNFNRSGNYHMRLLRADGATVGAEQIVHMDSPAIHRFRVGALPSGVYMVKIGSENAQTTQRILVW